MGKRLRVLYALGPGQVVSGYRDVWLTGAEAPFEMPIPFWASVLDWAKEADVEIYLISSHSAREVVRDGKILVENLPKPRWFNKPGLRYHLASGAYGLGIIARALRERSSIVVVDSGTTHWLLLSLLSITRTRVVAVLANTLWPAQHRPTQLSQRVLSVLNGLFFRHFAAATLCVSTECERQLREVAGLPRGPVYRPQYRRGLFERVNRPPLHAVRPFRVLFVGRIEEVKGVFQILSIAERLEKDMPAQFIWKICGSGGASESLISQLKRRGLNNLVKVTGRLPRDKLPEEYGWAHATIVPTTDGYAEGLAMTAVEAVLAGRPVVVSTVVPAWEILGDAAIRVQVNDLDGFAKTFRMLARDQIYYDRCVRATKAAQEQFYNSPQGLGATLGRAISALL